MNAPTPELSSLAGLLRQRAEGQRRVGYALLVAICLCIIVTGLLVQFAGKAVEAASADGIASPPLAATYQVYENANANFANDVVAKARACLKPGDPSSEQRSGELDGMLSARNRFAVQLDQAIQLADRRTEAMVKAQAMALPILGAVVARISFVLLGLFLVQVLVGSYRASSRMAAAYDSFADALLLQASGIGDLKTIVEALTPNVDFGANTAPTREVVDLATGLIKNQPARKD